MRSAMVNASEIVAWGRIMSPALPYSIIILALICWTLDFGAQHERDSTDSFTGQLPAVDPALNGQAVDVKYPRCLPGCQIPLG